MYSLSVSKVVSVTRMCVCVRIRAYYGTYYGGKIGRERVRECEVSR